MALKTTNPKSWSVAKYVVAVLWMEGRLGTAEIAQQVNWTGGQVKGFYCREFSPPRDVMTKAERQAVLDYLKGWSGWFDIFVDARFEDRFHAKELPWERRKRRALETADRPNDETRPPGKKELKRMAAEAEHQKRRDQNAREQREAGFAPRGVELDALAWLYANALGDRNETVSRGGLMSRDRRKEALLKFRGHLDGCFISPLQAQDYEAVSGAGGQKIALPEYRKFCIDMIGGARTMLAGDEFLMLEKIFADDFIWLNAKQGAARGRVYEAIRHACDALAVYYQMMSRDDFLIRWDHYLPSPTLPTKADARAASALAQETIDTLTRATA